MTPPVIFDDKEKKHIKDTIFLIVNKIIKLLSLPSKSFDIE